MLFMIVLHLQHLPKLYEVEIFNQQTVKNLFTSHIDRWLDMLSTVFCIYVLLILTNIVAKMIKVDSNLKFDQISTSQGRFWILTST